VSFAIAQQHEMQAQAYANYGNQLLAWSNSNLYGAPGGWGGFGGAGAGINLNVGARISTW